MKRGPLHTNSQGFSLVELLLAVSLFSIFVFAIGQVVSTAVAGTGTSAIMLNASHLAEEGSEAIRNLRDAGDDFVNIPDGTYGITVINDQWELTPTPDVVDIYTRAITIATINASQKRVTTNISWMGTDTQTKSITKDTYLTNWRALFNIGLTVDKTVINHGMSKVPSDFLPYDLTTLVWDYSVDPPVQVFTDIPIVFAPTTMTLGPGTYTFLTSNDPDYSVALSSDCVGNTILLADGDSKVCNITYEQYVVPTVTLPTATNISSSSATLGANVTSLGNPALISARGTCWGATPAPVTNCVSEGGTTTGVFTHRRTGLIPDTTYYYRGYATNSFGTGYSVDGTFTTEPGTTIPTVTTAAISGITQTAATSGGDVTSDGGAAVTARGVVWSTSINPTIALPTKTTDGSGTGVFVSSITSLNCNTLYYTRAYATNSVGTAYGDELSFRTASCVTYIASASAGATTITIPAHQVGDLLVIFAYRDGNTNAPSLPTGWTNIGTANGANSNASRLAYRVATVTNTPSGTWTNATGLVVHVYRGQNTLTPIGGDGNNGGNSTTVTYPAVTMTQANGSSWVAGFAGHRSINTSLETAPSGMTNRTNFVNATNEVSGHDTNGGVSSWTSTNVNVGGTSSGWRARTLEIISQ